MHKNQRSQNDSNKAAIQLCMHCLASFYDARPFSMYSLCFQNHTNSNYPKSFTKSTRELISNYKKKSDIPKSGAKHVMQWTDAFRSALLSYSPNKLHTNNAEQTVQEPKHHSKQTPTCTTAVFGRQIRSLFFFFKCVH